MDASEWNTLWNKMKVDYTRLQDHKEEFDEVFSPTTAHSRVQQAEACAMFAQDLCRFLTKYRDQGVFEALLDPSIAQIEARTKLQEQLQDALHYEAVLLERAGLAPERAQALVDDIERNIHPPYPIVERDIWNGHVNAGIDVVCKVPRTAVLLLAENLFDYTRLFAKKHGLAIAAIVGTANIILLNIDPTLILPTKVSKYLAVLVGNSTSTQ